MASLNNSSDTDFIEVEYMEEFTPKIHDRIVLFIFIMVITLIITSATLVQRAIFHTLKRFENRPINQMILPIMIVNSISVFPYCIVLLIKAVYYPLKDLTGTSFCHFHNYYDIWNVFIIQSQSFFVSLYRCICLFHSGVLQKEKITPKVLNLI